MRLTEARQIIDEVLDNPFPFTVRLNPDYAQWLVRWRTPDGKRGLMGVDPLGANTGRYDVVFSVNDKLTLTRSGDSFRTMATVIAALRQIMRTPEAQEHVRAVTLTAATEDKGRVRLYSRLVAKFGREFGMVTSSVHKKNSVHFALKRRKPAPVGS